MADEKLSDQTATTTLASGDKFYTSTAADADRYITFANIVTEVQDDLTLTASDISDFDTEVSNNSSVTANTAKNSYPSGDETKVGYISVTQAVDLDTMESDIATNSSKTTNATHTGDATGATTLTLATVNSNVGSFTNADVTVNAKGLVTAVSNGSSSAPEGTAIVSTGVTAGYVLQADGDDTSSWVALGGGGDMLASTYDPNTVAGDAFDMDNMVEGTAKILTAAERSAISTNTAKVSYTDAAKVAGIETGADVTDTTNVTSAGALMDSEVTNLAQVKAFDTTDYATAAQGSTADSAMQDLADDTTPQAGGDIDWNSKGMKLVSQTVGGSNGNAVYLSGSSTWSQADASAEATCSDQLAIRISATEVLTQGVYTTTGLTAGSIYYVSETAGAITATAPSTSTSIVRIIGYALSTTELMVVNDPTYIEVA